MAQHNELGKWGEEHACLYLIKKGYTIVSRNYKAGKRDIDIIALTEDAATLVFVEVKTRRTNDIASPEEAVTLQKMRSIGFAANKYVKTCNVDMLLRFDIIAITGDQSSTPEVEHITDAFNPCLL